MRPPQKNQRKRLRRWLASPWFSYGEFLQRRANHTCLIDIGIGAAFPGPVAANRSQADAHGGWNSTRVHTELELEMSLRQGRDLVQTVLADRSPAQSALFNRFAVFEHLNLLGISASYPCPGDNAACAANRPPRAFVRSVRGERPRGPFARTVRADRPGTTPCTTPLLGHNPPAQPPAQPSAQPLAQPSTR